MFGSVDRLFFLGAENFIAVAVELIADIESGTTFGALRKGIPDFYLEHHFLRFDDCLLVIFIDNVNREVRVKTGFGYRNGFYGEHAAVV